DGTVGGLPGGTNPFHGVFIFNSSATTVSANTIGGSAFSGILITNDAPGSVIENNNIGITRSGTISNQNTDGGVVVNGSADTEIGPANNISNNTGVDSVNSGGIVLTGSSVATTGTKI